MNLDDAIRAIQESDETALSAEARNALHGATTGHPWCEGKSFDQRKAEVRMVIAGRRVDANLRHAVDKATE